MLSKKNPGHHHHHHYHHHLRMGSISHGYSVAMVAVVVVATVSLATSTGCPERCECRQLAVGGVMVDCKGRGLTSVVSELPADATELDLGNNPIGSISRTSFPSGSKLRTLRIDGCLLERLERMTFRHLQLLEVLDISRNRIVDVDPGAFQGLQYLRSLNLENNNIRSPPSYLFRGLNLTELNLGGNDLQEIPDDLFGAAKIGTLKLDNNRLLSVSRQFLRPVEPYLRALSISSNLNPLTIASDAFAGVTLVNLSLAFAKLTNTSFLSNTVSWRIDLTGNELKSFALQQNSGLARTCSELVLRDVGLESLNESLFANLPRLNRLDLSGNQLVYFRAELFRSLQDLTHLDLSRNRFVRLPETFGPQMNSLENLNISHCALVSLDWDNMRAMDRLESLDLSGNRLQVIPENASSLLDSISFLNLSQNPWHCNCEMRWFRLWLAEERRPVGQVRCSSPEEGLMLNLSPRDFVCTPPTITFITPSKNIKEGSNVMLSCASQSDPAPAIVWRAPFGDVLSITPPEDRTRTKTIADWSIHRIKPYQSGWYSCNSSNLVQSNITYTFLQVVSSTDDEVDLNDLAFPMTPSRQSRQPVLTTSSMEPEVTTTTNSKTRETTSSTVATTSTFRPRSSEHTTTLGRLKIEAVTEESHEIDEVDGYFTPHFSLLDLLASGKETSTVPSTESDSIAGGAFSSERSADGATNADAGASSSLSQASIVIIIFAILGVFMVAVVVIIMMFVIYRRRRHRDYPVKEKQRRSSREFISEKTKLQMSNLDDSSYSSTMADPLNPSQNRTQLPN